jgi:hypothetical protein
MGISILSINTFYLRSKDIRIKFITVCFVIQKKNRQQIKHMKEFKFWAIPYSPLQLLILAMPLGLMFVLLLSPVNPFRHYSYTFAGTFILIVLFFLLFVKKVRVTFSETGTIRLYINGKEKIVAEPQQFEYVRGVDIRRTTNQSALYLVFNGKDFTFSLFETRGVKTTKQQEFLRYMVTTYNLEKELYKKSLTGTIYTYRNPSFKGISVTSYNKSEK